MSRVGWNIAGRNQRNADLWTEPNSVSGKAAAAVSRRRVGAKCTEGTTMAQTAEPATQALTRGRQRKFTPERIRQIKNLVEQGTSREKIAELIGVTVGCRSPARGWVSLFDDQSLPPGPDCGGGRNRIPVGSPGTILVAVTCLCKVRSCWSKAKVLQRARGTRKQPMKEGRAWQISPFGCSAGAESE